MEITIAYFQRFQTLSLHGRLYRRAIVGIVANRGTESFVHKSTVCIRCRSMPTILWRRTDMIHYSPLGSCWSGYTRRVCVCVVHMRPHFDRKVDSRIGERRLKVRDEVPTPTTGTGTAYNPRRGMIISHTVPPRESLMRSRDASE